MSESGAVPDEEEEREERGDAEEGFLGTATKVAGLLAGAIAAVYLLGGVVIALRLLFDGFSAGSMVTLLGQLPRELVITTAMLEVIGLAVIVGVLAALCYGALNGPRERRNEKDGRAVTDSKELHKLDLLNSQPRKKRTYLLLVLIALALTGPALFVALDLVEQSKTDRLIAVGFSFLVTLALVASGWFLLRRLARKKKWLRLPKAAAAGGLWAAMALVPALMFAGLLEFEDAQVCTAGSFAPVEGVLVGETPDHLLLATDFEDEESVLSLPADRVTKSEYGDLTSEFICEPVSAEVAAAEAAAAAEAEAALGEHGSETERELATELRPWLRFDSGERWRPLEVEGFVAESFEDGRGHRACPAPGAARCPDVDGIEELTSEVAFLDIHGEKNRDDDGGDGGEFNTPSDCERPAVVRDCVNGEGSVTYYRRTSHRGRWYWDYWWFFRFNDYTGKVNECQIICGDHEGDWEGVTVITTAAIRPEVLGTIYATHKDRVMVGAPILPVVGTHPLVFVAKGTHASYPFRCGGECDQYSPLPGFSQTHLPEESHDGRASWVHNRDDSCEEAECVRPLSEAVSGVNDSLPFAGSWAAWSGAWGETCYSEDCRKHHESSPRSPGRQARYQCPWVPTRLARPGARDATRTGSREVGDMKRLLAACEAQRGGL